MTTVRAALASANGIRSLQKRKIQVRSLQNIIVARCLTIDRSDLRRSETAATRKE